MFVEMGDSILGGRGDIMVRRREAVPTRNRGMQLDRRNSTGSQTNTRAGWFFCVKMTINLAQFLVGC